MSASADSGERPAGARFRCRAVIFDLDGTLLDTLPDLAAAVDQALIDLGLAPAGERRVRGWIGDGAKNLLAEALRHAGAGASTGVDAALPLFFEHYARQMTVRSREYPGVTATLQALSAQGLPLAVCTNKSSRFARPLLEHFGLLHLFAAVVGGDDLPAKKPDPAQLHHLASRLQLSTADCLMVGDSRNDVAAARAAGMPIAAVSYGYNQGASIADSKPDAVIDTMPELLPLIVRAPEPARL